MWTQIRQESKSLFRLQISGIRKIQGCPLKPLEFPRDAYENMLPGNLAFPLYLEYSIACPPTLCCPITTGTHRSHIREGLWSSRYISFIVRPPLTICHRPIKRTVGWSQVFDCFIFLFQIRKWPQRTVGWSQVFDCFIFLFQIRKWPQRSSFPTISSLFFTLVKEYLFIWS